jgi:death on curing protein
MLLQNSYLNYVEKFLKDMENTNYHVAAGNIDKELLGEIIEACINEEMDPESLKLNIFCSNLFLSS